MAIQWADDFSRYGTGLPSRTAMLDGLPYASLSTQATGGFVTASPDPNDSARVFFLDFNANGETSDFRVALPNVVSGTVGICFRAWLANLPVSSQNRPNLVGVLRSNGGYVAYIRIEQNGSITIHGQVGGVITQVFDSINPIVQPNSFNHFEYLHNTSAGTGQLYVNGVLRCSYSGVDTGINLVFASLSPRSTGAQPMTNTWIKDLVIWDSTGSKNNTVMGTVIVRRQKPNGDITLGGWTPSTGTSGFSLLAKDAPNDATFLSADDTPPAEMIFNMENLPADVTSVRGLVTVVRSRKIDGGDGNLQAALSPNGTDWDNGEDRPITSAFTYDFDVSELDPDTADSWTPAAVDNIQLRIDRTV